MSTGASLQRLVLTLVVAVTVTGLAYGFSCFVDKVQTWVAFNVGVEHSIQ